MSRVEAWIREAVERRPWALVASAGLAALIVRLALAPYGAVFVSDEFAYLIKSLEILRGNLVPMQTHAIGWPVALAGAFALLPDMDILARMSWARVVSSVIDSCSVLPLFVLGRALLGAPATAVLLFLFVFSAGSIVSAGSGMAEPLFTLLMLSALAFAVFARASRRFAWLAGASAGLAYWVRFNGLFVLASSLIVIAWPHRRAPRMDALRLVAAVVAAFLLVASPVAVQRALVFGSPTFNGENSKYFIDDYEQLFSNNVPVPTFREYLARHDVADYLDKFVVHGTLAVTRDLFRYAVGLPMLPFFAAGVWWMLRERSPALLPVAAVFLVWVAGMTPVYEFWNSSRFVRPAIPVLLIPIACSAVAIGGRRSRRYVAAVLLVAFAAGSLAFAAVHRARALDDRDRDGVVWGKWIATNVKGKVALIEEASFIMMHLPDASVAGAGLMDMYAPRSGLSTVRPGYFRTLDAAMAWFRDIGVTHLVVDDVNVARRPYLEEIRPDALPAWLEQVFSNYGTDSRWKVRIYRIRWDRYPRPGS